MTAPDPPPARSFVYRRLLAAGARFDRDGGARRIADGDEEVARRLGLADLSLAPRAGFKGCGALAWLAGRGAAAPDRDNRAAALPDGARLARLAPGEALLLGGRSRIAALEAAWRDERPVACYPAPRGDSHCWLRILGDHAPAMLAKLCAVDLRPHRFAALEVAQTFVARLAAIVLRDDAGAAPGYHLLADSASAVYLWDCLLDAMAEFDGGPVGTEALAALGDPCLGG